MDLNENQAVEYLRVLSEQSSRIADLLGKLGILLETKFEQQKHPTEKQGAKRCDEAYMRGRFNVVDELTTIFTKLWGKRGMEMMLSAARLLSNEPTIDKRPEHGGATYHADYKPTHKDQGIGAERQPTEGERRNGHEGIEIYLNGRWVRDPGKRGSDYGTQVLGVEVEKDPLSFTPAEQAGLDAMREAMERLPKRGPYPGGRSAAEWRHFVRQAEATAKQKQKDYDNGLYD